MCGLGNLDFVSWKSRKPSDFRFLSVHYNNSLELSTRRILSESGGREEGPPQVCRAVSNFRGSGSSHKNKHLSLVSVKASNCRLL